MLLSTKRVEIVAIVAIIVVISAIGAFYYIQYTGEGTTSIALLSSFNVESITISNVTGNVYVASSNAQQIQGFQNVTSFGNCNGRGNCIGMIFVFGGDSNLCFWMHNTKIPLEQVWIAQNGTVVAVYQAPPENDNSVCHFGAFVLETSTNMKIAVGDTFTQNG